MGLDHHQVRTWADWHGFITLAMLALAFLMACAAEAGPRQAASGLADPSIHALAEWTHPGWPAASPARIPDPAAARS